MCDTKQAVFSHSIDVNDGSLDVAVSPIDLFTISRGTDYNERLTQTVNIDRVDLDISGFYLAPDVTTKRMMYRVFCFVDKTPNSSPITTADVISFGGAAAGLITPYTRDRFVPVYDKVIKFSAPSIAYGRELSQFCFPNIAYEESGGVPNTGTIFAHCTSSVTYTDPPALTTVDAKHVRFSISPFHQRYALDGSLTYGRVFLAFIRYLPNASGFYDVFPRVKFNVTGAVVFEDGFY